MILKIKYTILALLGSIFLKAQVNLVPNSSFEDIIICPDYFSEFYNYTDKWFSPNIGTPDLYNGCSNPNEFVGIPSFYIDNLLPFDGQGFSGIILFRKQTINPGIHNREYIAIKLTNNLIVDSLYNLKFHVSLANGANTAISNIGALISSDSVYQNNFYPPIHIDTSIIVKNDTNNIINNKGIWTELSFNFKADGGEKYLYIGNFDTDSRVIYTDLDTIADNLLESYYLIDKISLTKTTEVGINEKPIEQIKIYPNPAQDYIYIDLPQNYGQLQLNIYNLTGQLISQKQLTQPNQNIPIPELGNGIYIFVIQNKDRVIGRQRVVVAR